MAIYSPLPVQPGENLRATLIAVPVPCGAAANGLRSVSTVRGGMPPPAAYPLERVMSPLPMRWASPVRERGPGAATGNVVPVPIAPLGVPVIRSFSPTRQVIRQGNM
eukprot:Skav228521  [mRNA]  locus=scaffold796:6664:8667:+ [translate_table: standard]